MPNYSFVVHENAKYLRSNIMILLNIAVKNVHSVFYKSFNEGDKSNALLIFILKWVFPSIRYLLFFPMGLCCTPLHFCV